MNKIINRTAKLILSPQKTILASALIIGGTIIASRVFGFLRYRALASYFSKEQLDLFFAAFRIPDFIYEILISGAFAATFIPIFIKYEHDKKSFTSAMNSILNMLFILLFLLIAIIFIFTNSFIHLIAPGIPNENKELIIIFSRILLLTQLPLLIFGSVISGIAQSQKRFMLSSIAPILYNLGIILGTIFFSSAYGLYGPLIGVIIGSLLFVLIQLPLLSVSGFHFKWFSLHIDYIKEFVLLYIPRIFTVIITQIDLTVDLALSTLIGPGSYTIFYFAQHLSLFPVSFIGMSFGQAALPYLSDYYKNNQIEKIKNIIIDSILQLLFASIPFTVFFAFSRTPLVRFFYGGERFDWHGTIQTAYTLSVFSLSIPFHTIFYFLTRCFYAFHDTKTPFFIGLISVGINTITSFIFVYIYKYPIWILGITFTLSISVHITLLIIMLSKKLNGLYLKKLILNTLKILISALIASVPSYAILKLFDGLILDTTRTINLILLLIITAILYLSLYLLICWILSVKELYIIKKALLKAKHLKSRVISYYTDIG